MSDNLLLVVIVLLILLFAGDPDLHDAIVKRLMKGTCP